MNTDSAAVAHLRRKPSWLVATVAGLFGLFYAYAVWNAVAYLAARTSILNGLGWALLLFACAFPVLVFAAALALGLRRTTLQLALILLTGLGLTAVFWLNVLSYSYTGGEGLVVSG